MKRFLLALFAAALVAFSSCEKGAVTLILDKTSVEMKVGETLQLIASVTAQTPAAPQISWSSSNPKVATVTSEEIVDVTGVPIPGGWVTALSVGETLITAKAGDAEAMCKVVVSENGATTEESFTIEPSPVTLAIDGEQVLTAVMLPANPALKVEWKCDKPGIVALGTLSSTQAKVQGLSEGKATVTAYADGKSATCEITVEAGSGTVIPVESITLNKTELEMTVGQQFQLEATVLPENATYRGDNDLEWTTTDPYKVYVNGGLVTAYGAGEATVTVTSRSNREVSASCKVTVTAAPPQGGRICYQTSDNYGNNRLYVDGALFSKTSETVVYIKNEGSWIWHYAKNDGFYREKEKVLSYGASDLGENYLFQAFDVKDGYLHILLSEPSPSKYYSVRTINLKTGESKEVKLNLTPFADMVCCTSETSICAADDGKVYALVSARENSVTYSGAYQWTSILYAVTPSDGKVEVTELIKGDSVSSMVGDLEIGPDGSVYALVNYRVVDDNTAKKAFVLFKDAQEVRRYEGYSDKGSSTPCGISVDGTDVYLFLKQSDVQTADIYKNADKLLGNFTSVSGGKIGFIGDGLYCYSINTVEQNTTATKLYRSDNKLLFNQAMWIIRLVVAK